MIIKFEEYIKEVALIADYDQERGYGTSFYIDENGIKYKREKTNRKKYKDPSEKNYKKQSL